ncbi:hypothetical protein C2G38_2218212 [Gigaspora rosea]|uniref:Collagen triple helix repeat protein n=1 Tax=Gigaspora rosea TaxID=44941 RepID=A0A397U6X6_9GLOM|nr:hypothetical protein C2G38_2218212 [Gigaspora rosea]
MPVQPKKLQDKTASRRAIAITLKKPNKKPELPMSLLSYCPRRYHPLSNLYCQPPKLLKKNNANTHTNIKRPPNSTNTTRNLSASLQELIHHEKVKLVKLKNETGDNGDTGDTGKIGETGEIGDTGDTGDIWLYW